jgi:hypothetical protein
MRRRPLPRWVPPPGARRAARPGPAMPPRSSPTPRTAPATNDRRASPPPSRSSPASPAAHHHRRPHPTHVLCLTLVRSTRPLGSHQRQAHQDAAPVGRAPPAGAAAHRSPGCQRQEPGAEGRGLAVCGGGLFEDDVGVGAADAERRHRRPRGPAHPRPGRPLGQQRHRTRRPVHVRRRLHECSERGAPRAASPAPS